MTMDLTVQTVNWKKNSGKDTYILAMLLLFSIFFSSLNLAAQTAKIQVFDNNSKVALPSAHVTFKCLEGEDVGQKQNSITDLDGVVNNPYNTHTLIEISSMGYETLTDTLNGLQTKNYYLKEDEINLNQVVITAQYLPNNPDKIVHKIRIIDAKQIKMRAANNLGDALATEMNMRISRDNILGSSLSIQGLSGQNVKILIDGVPQIGRVGGNIDLDQINLQNIERIEIVEGPLSVDYGTNALAGAINLITKKNQADKWLGNISSYAESTGQINVNAEASYKKESNRYAFSGGRNYFNGWTPEAADTSRFKQWKPKEQYFARAQYNYEYRKLRFHFAGDYYQDKITNRGMPRSPYFETAFDDYYRTYRNNYTINLTDEVAKHRNVNLTFAYNRYKRIKNTYFKNLVTLEENLSPNTTDQDTSKFSAFVARGTYNTTKPDRLVNYEFGYDVFLEIGNSWRLKGNEQEISDYAFFASAEIKPSDNLTIRPGMRKSYNTVYQSPFIPSVNIRYKLSKGLSMRTSYARGFRAPSLKDLYFDFVDSNHNIQGNPNLLAENSNNLQLSVSQKNSTKKGFFKLEGMLFYNNVNNLIDLVRIDGTEYTYKNIGNYQTLGGQLNANYNLERVSLAVGANFTGTKNLLSESTEKLPFNFSPEIRTQVSYNIPNINTQVALFYKYNGKYTDVYLAEDDILQEEYIASYHTLDLTTSTTLFKDRLTVSLGGKNLFNVTNVNAFTQGDPHAGSSDSVPLNWGATFFAKMSFNVW